MAQDELAQEHYQLDPMSGCTLVGGDMIGWSDLDRSDRDHAAAVELSLDLVRQIRPEHLILVGPTASGLVDRIPAQIATSVLVRGLQDARQVQRAVGSHDNLVVHCGSLDRFTPRQSADLVLALDPLHTLCSPDSPPWNVQDALTHLAAMVSPDGLVVVEIENALGTERLLTLPSANTAVDFDHAVGGSPRGVFHQHLPEALVTAGLTTRAIYCGYPSAHEPTMLIDTDSAATAHGDWAALMAGRAAADSAAHQPSLTDPADLVRRIFAADLAVPLAPSWIVVAAKGNDSTDFALPGVVYAEPGSDSPWRSAVSVTDGDLRSLREGVAAAGSLERDLRRAYELPGQPGGSSQLLEDRLLAACATRDLPAIRSLIAGYAQWLRGETFAGDGAAALAFATADNTVLADERFFLLDPSWSWRAPLESADVAIAHNLKRFAYRLVLSGATHPWVDDATPEVIAESLALSAAIDWDDVSAPVQRLEERIAEAIWPGASGPRPREVSPLGTDDVTALASDTTSLRATLRRNAALTEQLRVQAARIDWLERHSEWRDRQYANLERRMAKVQASAAYKVVDKLGAPKRKAIATARATVLEQLPPGFKDKAEAAVRKIMQERAEK